MVTRSSCTAWPPNWLRSAASIRSANGLSSRERKRVNSAAVSTGSGTPRSIPSLERPAPFAGVLDVALERGEVGVLGERARRQLEQPRSHDAALVPQRGDRAEIDLVVAGVHQLEAFGVGLHQAVFDAVVDHLHVVAGAVVADAQIAVLRRQRQEDRLEPLADLGFAADHQAVAFLQPPDAAAGAGVDVVDALGRQRLRAPHVVVKVGVAAVDDGVAGRQQAAERGDGRLGGIARTAPSPRPRAARRAPRPAPRASTTPLRARRSARATASALRS